MADQAEIHRKAVSSEDEERREAAKQLQANFAVLPDKKQAWDDLIRLAQDEDWRVRSDAANAVGTAFPLIPDKEQAWNDLHRLTQDKDSDVRNNATRAIGNVFPLVSGKQQAWNDLIRLNRDKDSDVQENATRAIGNVFPLVSDKEQAWNDLIRLTLDEGSNVHGDGGYVLGTAFPLIPDKEQAWNDLHRLAQDEDSWVREGVATAVGKAFPFIPDKELAWDDLHRLAQDEDSWARHGVASALGDAFSYIPDKEQAWDDLHRLTQDEDWRVRESATSALGDGFSLIPDKEQAWNDLHRLTQDVEWSVRFDAAIALGSSFPLIPDKEQAWDDLHRLTQGGEDWDVVAYASYYLGRISIFKAIEAESEKSFGNELKKAIDFFDDSSVWSKHSDPSEFCLPFYRSFYTITFEKQKSEVEVQKYLAAAKRASYSSKSRAQLLEAVENLANALRKAKSLRESNLETIKRDLNAYRWYFDHAVDSINAAAEETPGAARVLRRGLPIIDEQIKEIIREIQEKARAVCKQTRGTPLEELGQETTRYAQELPAQNPLALTIALSNMSSIARDWCEYIPADKRIHACEELKNLVNMELSEQSVALARVFEYINTNIRIPRIQTVHISATQQEIVRLAVVQICFELTESFPFGVKNKGEVKAKIFSALKIAREDGANIVCLPELCLCEEWINEIKEEYLDMIVIGGSFYKDNKNICPVITKSNIEVEIPPQPKMTPSAPEYFGIMGPRMTPGEAIYKYETQFGRFVILICRDFDNLIHYFRNTTEIDIIFCPAFNPKKDRFHREADIHIEKTPSYVLIANTGVYGGTSIFGLLNKNYFSTLVDGGCKDAEDLTNKLCEVKEGREEVILADFNLIYKSTQVPTPSDPNEEIRSIENIKKIPIQLKQI